MRTKIIFEDADIIVIHKPAGLAVQTAHIGQQDVVSELKNYLAAEKNAAGKPEKKDDGQKGKRRAGGPPYLGIVHRLDQPVEGLLVFGKTPAAAAALSGQLQSADFCKEYLAAVCGKPAAAGGELVDYLGKKDGRAVVYNDVRAVRNGSGGVDVRAVRNGSNDAEGAKKAVLHFEVTAENESAEGMISLLKVQLETGRFHQIRAQLSRAGSPILGDVKYGNEKSLEVSKKLGIKNTALCACRLIFTHPVTKKKMEYTVSPDNPVFALFSE